MVVTSRQHPLIIWNWSSWITRINTFLMELAQRISRILGFNFVLLPIQTGNKIYRQRLEFVHVSLRKITRPRDAVPVQLRIMGEFSLAMFNVSSNLEYSGVWYPAALQYLKKLITTHHPVLELWSQNNMRPK